MSDILLNLDTRTAEGKKVAKLRQGGYVPSVVYGGHDQVQLTQSKVAETTKAIHAAGKHSPVNLVIDGTKHLAIVKTIDIDPVRRELRHIAFHTINKNDVITTEVPVLLVGLGDSAAERAGLVILQAIEHLEIKAKPADLPEAIELSLTSLTTTEDKLTVGDVKLPSGVEFADVDQDLDLVIANVYEPSALQAANDAAAGTAEDVTEVAAEKGAEVTADAAKADATSKK